MVVVSYNAGASHPGAPTTTSPAGFRRAELTLTATLAFKEKASDFRKFTV
jgi:hypothetical protein